MQMISQKQKPALVSNLIIGLMSFGAWIFMAVLKIDNTMLATNGLSSLKFFTVLSNLLNGSVALLYVYWLIRNKEITSGKRLLKLTSTSLVGLTFGTVMVFLGPLYGYGNMFRGANLWMHLLLPLLSFLTFIVFEEGPEIPLRQTILVSIPTLLYEIGYLTNILINGIGTPPHSNDFYGFLSWGYGVGILIALGMLLITWLIALLFRALGRSSR